MSGANTDENWIIRHREILRNHSFPTVLKLSKTVYEKWIIFEIKNKFNETKSNVYFSFIKRFIKSVKFRENPNLSMIIPDLYYFLLLFEGQHIFQ